MADQVSEETQALFDAAELAIARSKEIVEQTRRVHSACAMELRAQERRLMFLREARKPN
ncbi:hypothetical protein [Bradyrhizobium sp. USDA 3256]